MRISILLILAVDVAALISQLTQRGLHSSRVWLAKSAPKPYDALEGAEALSGPEMKVIPLSTLHDVGETNEYSFTVFGEPVALQRHRTVTGGLRTYNPSAQQQKNFANACIQAQVLPDTPLEGPVEATMTFYFTRPKSHYRTGKYAGIMKEDQDVYHYKKKDLDNLVKFVLDSLNTLAYLDDGQICSIICKKFYVNGVDDVARSEIRFRKLSNVLLLRDDDEESATKKTVTAATSMPGSIQTANLMNNKETKETEEETSASNSKIRIYACSS